MLRQKHARQWLGELAPWLMDFGVASYPYDFFRGQLSSIACYVLSLKFASELRRSPYCRLLRELSLHSTEVVSETMELDGRRFEAGRDYGLETLVSAACCEISRISDQAVRSLKATGVVIDVLHLP